MSPGGVLSNLRIDKQLAGVWEFRSTKAFFRHNPHCCFLSCHSCRKKGFSVTMKCFEEPISIELMWMRSGGQPSDNVTPSFRTALWSNQQKIVCVCQENNCLLLFLRQFEIKGLPFSAERSFLVLVSGAATIVTVWPSVVTSCNFFLLSLILMCNLETPPTNQWKMPLVEKKSKTLITFNNYFMILCIFEGKKGKPVMQSNAHSLWVCYHHMFSLCLSLDFKPAGVLVSSAFHSIP